MATEIKTGGVYEAKRFRSGSNEKGDWELIATRDAAKGSREITIFPTNVPCGVMEGGKFRVGTIKSVKIKAKKGPEGEWNRSETVMRAETFPVASEDVLGDDYDPFNDTGDLL